MALIPIVIKIGIKSLLEYFAMRLNRFTISIPLVQVTYPVILLVFLGVLSRSAGGNSQAEVTNVVPWESQYKIKPDQKDRLTAADVVGPDGIVYPNWTKCGVQGGISSVIFYNGWNCWAKDVTVKKCGRFPVYCSMAKWCEIRDCVFDDAWFKGGGTAYTGWDRCWGCGARPERPEKCSL